MSRRRLTVSATTIWAAAAFVVTVAIALLGVSRDPGTPFDEAAHLDYVVKLAHGEMPTVDDRYGQTVLRELACDDPRGEAWAGLEPCDSPRFSPELAPFAGQSTATNYAPTYYLLTAAPYRLCEETSSWSPRDCGRVANTLWLGWAAAGFLTLMALLGCSPAVSLLVSVGVSVAPAMLLQGITVNPDAAVHAMVAWLAVLAVVLAARTRLRPWSQVLWLGAAGLVAVTARETALVGLAVVMLLLGFLLSAGEPRRVQLSRWALVAVTFGAVVALSGLNRLAQPVLRGTGGENTLQQLSQVPTSGLDEGALGAFTASMSPFTVLPWPALANPWLLALSVVVTGLAWAMALQIRLPEPDLGGGLSLPPQTLGPSAFPVVATVTAWTGASALLVLTWLGTGSTPVQPRYYMTTAALLLVLGTATTGNRWVRGFSATVSGLIIAAVTVSLLVT
jgi:hypothetical protein